jgi:(E)-4-hydroxy-3-methyl-but-2-enyl pyrophosphate reductase
MKITLAQTAGFCMGVRRAVELALDAPNQYKNPICTFGPLIHNPQVLSLLTEKGIVILSDVPDKGRGTVLIRAHGVPPETKKALKKAGFAVVDATCPRVIKVQTIIRKHAQKGYETIIVGDQNHPEVVGLCGFADHKAHVVGGMDELKALPDFKKAIIVAQTTQNVPFFNVVKKWVKQSHPHYKVFHTICDSTEKRQAEVNQMAESVEAVVVVGGKESGNTQRLAKIAAAAGKPTYHIETEAELDAAKLMPFDDIGITAGASTPNWVIKKVYRSLEMLPVRKKKSLSGHLLKLLRALLLTNLYVAFGAGLLCYACAQLMGIKAFFPYLLISVVYVLSMHMLNNLTSRDADSYNDPERAAFYLRYKPALTALAVAAGAVGLITAYPLGLLPFTLLLVMSILGLSYNLRFVPEGFRAIKYRRIRDIPGSKTILIALAWGTVTVLLPALSVFAHIGFDILIVFAWSVGMVYVRTAFFDILDMQGDRIVGKDTVPLVLGEARAYKQLQIILAILVLLLLSAGIGDMLPGLAVLLTVCPVFTLFVLRAHTRSAAFPSVRLEFLVESNFVLAGILSLLWALF